jgi:hypothetical protein
MKRIGILGILLLLIMSIDLYAAGDMIVNGNLGIGVANPVQRLEIAGGHAVLNSNRLVLLSKDDISYYYITGAAWNTGLEYHYYSGHRFFTDTDTVNPKVTITQSGSIGIGTTSPTEKLQVEGNMALNGTYSAIWFLPYGSGFQRNGDRNLDFIASVTDGGILPGSDNAFRLGKSDRRWGEGYFQYLYSSTNVGVNTTSPTAKLDVNSDIIRVRTAKTPASASAAGNQGDICWDANYVYICVATNTWKRASLGTW